MLKNLLMFNFAAGWRTYVIIAFVVLAFVAENLLGIDLPGYEATWETVILALGLGTAANHKPT